MYDITHLLDKHRREMEELENEHKREQRRRENRLKELDNLLNEAIQLNSSASEEELRNIAI
jgi:glycine cleavage system regulatory protein